MSRRYPIPVEELRLPVGPDSGLRLDAALEPTDEAIALLSLVAEVEHVFLLHYLYAAYSVRTADSGWSRQTTGVVRGIRVRLIELAREEMGHLMTVQNLLIAIGAPVHFERADDSEHYPYRFALEPLCSASLAKYIAAERPVSKPASMPESEWDLLPEIERQARVANGGVPVRHLERVLLRLTALLGTEIPAEAFYADTGPRQARWQDWGYDAGVGGADRGRKVHVEGATGRSVTEVRAQALAALRTISGQGEGARTQPDSHFHRLMHMYAQVRDLERLGVNFTWPVVVNPTTNVSPRQQPIDADVGIAAASGSSVRLQTPISDPRARAWARLGDIRYRALLCHLVHFLHLDGPRYVAVGVGLGDRTPRGLLLAWAFEEMQNLRRIAGKLVTLPAGDGDGHAGMPFRMPTPLMTGARESARWRGHLNVALSTVRLLDELLLSSEGAPLHLRGGADRDAADPFLLDLRRAEERRIVILRALKAGAPIPDEARARAFAKVGRILEEAIRGADIGAHDKFWTKIDRDRFVDLHLFGIPLIGCEPRNQCYLSPDYSSLIWMLNPQHPDGRDKAESERMPRFRPPMPPSRVSFLKAWIARQAPDSDPPGRTESMRDPVIEPTPAKPSEPPPEPGSNAGPDAG